MSRQNLKQGGRNPWVAHGSLDGAPGFATDAMQLFGPAFRETGAIDLAGRDLASLRLQHEAACAILQSQRAELPPAASTTWTFFGLYRRDHASPSGDADLAEAQTAQRLARAFEPRDIALASLSRSAIQKAPCAAVRSRDEDAVAELWPERLHEEWRDGRRLSFFTSGGRHVVFREKEKIVTRRHGAIVRSG